MLPPLWVTPGSPIAPASMTAARPSTPISARAPIEAPTRPVVIATLAAAAGLSAVMLHIIGGRGSRLLLLLLLPQLESLVLQPGARPERRHCRQTGTVAGGGQDGRRHVEHGSSCTQEE